MELVDRVNAMFARSKEPPQQNIGKPPPARIDYYSTLYDIVIDGDDRLENERWGDHVIAAFEKLNDYLINIREILEKAQKEIEK